MCAPLDMTASPRLLAPLVAAAYLPIAACAGAPPPDPTPPRPAPAPADKAAPLPPAATDDPLPPRAGAGVAIEQQWRAALADRQAAASERPSDPAAVSELAWAAFLAGDLDRAEAAANRALRLARKGAMKGASLYQLARIREARGDRSGARKALQRALRARPGDRVVGAALARLRPSDHRAVYKLAAACAVSLDHPDEHDEPGPDSVCEELTPAGSAAGFRAVRVGSASGETSEAEAVLLRRDAQGWTAIAYLGDDIQHASAGDAIGTSSVQVKDIDVEGEGDRQVVRVAVELEYQEGGERTSSGSTPVTWSRENQVVLCAAAGAGPCLTVLAGAAGATTPVREFDARPDLIQTAPPAFEVDVIVRDGMALVVPLAGTLPVAAESLVGWHKLW